MKLNRRRAHIAIIACLLLLPILAAGAPQPEGPPARDPETRMLSHLLTMTPDELAKLRLTIERIEEMSPEEKELMRQRLQRLERMPPEAVRALRERIRAIDPELRAQMRANWQALSPEERRAWRRKLRDMDPEERQELLTEERLLPRGAEGRQRPKGDTGAADTRP
jgi:hypothetical protein